jgi:hypothetical protein
MAWQRQHGMAKYQQWWCMSAKSVSRENNVNNGNAQSQLWLIMAALSSMASIRQWRKYGMANENRHRRSNNQYQRRCQRKQTNQYRKRKRKITVMAKALKAYENRRKSASISQRNEKLA